MACKDSGTHSSVEDPILLLVPGRARYGEALVPLDNNWESVIWWIPYQPASQPSLFKNNYIIVYIIGYFGLLMHLTHLWFSHSQSIWAVSQSHDSIVYSEQWPPRRVWHVQSFSGGFPSPITTSPFGGFNMVQPCEIGRICPGLTSKAQKWKQFDVRLMWRTGEPVKDPYANKPPTQCHLAIRIVVI